MPSPSSLAARFRGFLPVVIDMETGGFDPRTDAILDVAGVLLRFDDGLLTPGAVHHYEVEPRAGTHIDPASLAFTGIDLEALIAAGRLAERIVGRQLPSAALRSGTLALFRRNAA